MAAKQLQFDEAARHALLRGVEKLAKGAAVAAKAWSTIGNASADAMRKAGKGATMTAEEAKSIETSLDVVERMQFDKGYPSPYSVTTAESMEALLDNPYILIHEKK